MTDHLFRVESGSMRCLVWAANSRAAIRQARHRRRWLALGVLTRIQRRRGTFWEPWCYVQTDARAQEPTS